MADALQSIKSPIAKELKQFEQKFREHMRSRVSLLNHITHYIVKRKGKRIRPMFVLLSARMHGDIGESTYRAASLIELLHTATLVHDDVVDEAWMRRGIFSINALWKNKIAVLVGDYLLSKGLLLSLDNNEAHLLQIVSNAVREMSEGELLQIEKARRLDIDESIYFDIIQKKTASLIASACAVGAASTGVGPEVVDKMYRFGELTGIAFQIKDDLFDFGEEDVGKPRAIDIKERKMTLPLIYTLNHASQKEKRWIINTVKRYNEDQSRVKELVKKVHTSGGIQYAKGKMYMYRDQALELLQTLPEGEANEALKSLVEFVVNRQY